jgi:hypothetical protein
MFLQFININSEKMKKLTMIFLLLIALTIKTNAQIPNNGFENWVTAGKCQVPVGWACINDWMGLTENCFGISRSADHYPANIGSYSIKIENTTSIYPDAGAYGLIWTGDSTGFGTDQPAFPLTAKITSFCGYYKFLPQNGDSLRIFIGLYKNGAEVTQASLISPVSVTVWTPFTIAIPAYTDADSARIMISSFNADNFGQPPHGNSILYIDNLSFDNLITSFTEKASESTFLNFYPNPTTGKFKIQSDQNTSNKINLKIYNLLGEKIFEKSDFNPQSSNEIDLSNSPKGIYLIKINDGENRYSKKVVIE